MIALGLALLAGAAYLLGRHVHRRADHEPRALRLLHRLQLKAAGAPWLQDRPAVPPWCGCGQDAEIVAIRRLGEMSPSRIACVRCNRGFELGAGPVEVPIAGSGATRRG